MSDQDEIVLPDWCHVGAAVVTFTPNQWKDGGSIKKATVKSVGKRDVVLDDGQRFNVRQLERRNGTWSPSTYLLAPDDPQVLAASAANRRQRRFNEAATAWEKFARSKTAEDGQDVVDAVQAWLDVQS